MPKKISQPRKTRTTKISSRKVARKSTSKTPVRKIKTTPVRRTTKTKTTPVRRTTKTKTTPMRRTKTKTTPLRRTKTKTTPMRRTTTRCPKGKRRNKKTGDCVETVTTKRQPSKTEPLRKKTETPNIKIKSIAECVDSKQGRRAYQEDRHVSVTDKNIPISMFALMDGHGGADVSEALIGKFKDLTNVFLNDRSLFDDKIKFKNEMRKQFIKIDEDMQKEGKKAGSTAVMAMVDVEKKLLYLINLGDSRAIVMQNGEIIKSTKDMKPDDPNERKRIENLGGVVTGSEWMGYRVQGILAIARSFGDYDLKPYVSNKPKVYGPISIKTKTTVVLATDGLWDVISNDDAKLVVNEFSKLGNYKILCEVLSGIALKKGSSDNVTVMTAIIG